MKSNLTSRYSHHAARALKLLSLLFCLSVVFTGCKKGDTGPAGPAGAAGPTGPAGSPNVQYSDWFMPPTYTKTVVFGLNQLNYDKAVAAITQPVLDSGSVLVYGKLNGYVTSVWPTDQVSQLPIVVQYLSGTTAESDSWSALITAGNLRISFTNNNNLYGSLATTHQFRYIVIPGGVKLTSSHNTEKQGSTETNAIGSGSAAIRNWKDLSYGEVCAALRIPE